MMHNQFEGKKLLVVGGSSSGFESNAMCAQQGGNVLIVGHRPEKTAEARDALAEFGAVRALSADLTSELD
jgi:cation diffusion facilitator CzcD-associated flavoprotein CzcO